jgi:hypothetical protein
LNCIDFGHQTCTDRFIDVYLHALGSDSTILEKEYVPFLLSIDNLQHPLLCNAECLPGRSQESGDYEFTVEQFLELRLPLLQGAFYGSIVSRIPYTDTVLQLFLVTWTVYCVSSMQGMSHYALTMINTLRNAVKCFLLCAIPVL